MIGNRYHLLSIYYMYMPLQAIDLLTSFYSHSYSISLYFKIPHFADGETEVLNVR